MILNLVNNCVGLFNYFYSITHEIIHIVKLLHIYGLGYSRVYAAELAIALLETLHFPWDLVVPATLGVGVNSFSLSSFDVTNGIKSGRPYVGITIIWHRDLGSNIQVKRYESARILGLSVTIVNGASILFINIYFPVACHEKYEEYIMCLGILSSILEYHEEDHACMHTGRL